MCNPLKTAALKPCWGPTGARVVIRVFLKEVGQELASQSEQESDKQRGGKAFWVKEMALAETRWWHSMRGVKASPWLDRGLGPAVGGKGGHRRLWAQRLKVRGRSGEQGKRRGEGLSVACQGDGLALVLGAAERQQELLSRKVAAECGGVRYGWTQFCTISLETWVRTHLHHLAFCPGKSFSFLQKSFIQQKS